MHTLPTRRQEPGLCQHATGVTWAPARQSDLAQQVAISTVRDAQPAHEPIAGEKRPAPADGQSSAPFKRPAHYDQAQTSYRPPADATISPLAQDVPTGGALDHRRGRTVRPMHAETSPSASPVQPASGVLLACFREGAPCSDAVMMVQAAIDCTVQPPAPPVTCTAPSTAEVSRLAAAEAEAPAILTADPAVMTALGLLLPAGPVLAGARPASQQAQHVTAVAEALQAPAGSEPVAQQAAAVSAALAVVPPAAAPESERAAAAGLAPAAPVALAMAAITAPAATSMEAKTSLPTVPLDTPAQVARAGTSTSAVDVTVPDRQAALSAPAPDLQAVSLYDRLFYASPAGSLVDKASPVWWYWDPESRLQVRTHCGYVLWL